jgi:hypothetical protein
VSLTQQRSPVAYLTRTLAPHFFSWEGLIYLAVRWGDDATIAVVGFSSHTPSTLLRLWFGYLTG